VVVLCGELVSRSRLVSVAAFRFSPKMSDSSKTEREFSFDMEPGNDLIVMREELNGGEHDQKEEQMGISMWKRLLILASVILMLIITIAGCISIKWSGDYNAEELFRQFFSWVVPYNG
jgi:hypothetical protein